MLLGEAEAQDRNGKSGEMLERGERENLGRTE